MCWELVQPTGYNDEEDNVEGLEVEEVIIKLSPQDLVN